MLGRARRGGGYTAPTPVSPCNIGGGVECSCGSCLWCEFVFFSLVAAPADCLPVGWCVGASPACGDDVVCFGAVGVAGVLVVEDNSAEWAVGDACLVVSREHGAAEVLMPCGSCAAGGHCGHHLGVPYNWRMEIKSSARRHGIADEELATWFEESSPEDYEIMIDGTAQALLFRAARMKKLGRGRSY